MNRDELIYVDFVKNVSHVTQTSVEEVDDEYRRFFTFIVEFAKKGYVAEGWLYNEMKKMELFFPNQTYMIYEYGNYVKAF